MREFNFFRPYLNGKNIKQLSSKGGRGSAASGKSFVLIPLLLLTLMILGLGGMYYVQYSEVSDLEAKISNLDLELSSTKLRDGLKEVEDKTRQAEKYQTEGLVLVLFGIQLENMDSVNGHIMDFLSQRAIANLYLKGISIQENRVNLEGFSLERNEIADLEYDFRLKGDFKRVFVENIEKVEALTEDHLADKTYYNFRMMMQTKGGSQNENQ